MPNDMKTKKKNWEKTVPMAAYFVQLRAFERKLLIEAFKLNRDHRAVAAVFGVPPRYIKQRMRFLGGVAKGDPVQEPPRFHFSQGLLRSAAAGAAAAAAKRLREKHQTQPLETPPVISPALAEQLRNHVVVDPPPEAPVEAEEEEVDEVEDDEDEPTEDEPADEAGDDDDA